MSGDDLFAAEEDVIALGEQLIADGSFGSVEDKRRYQQLLKELPEVVPHHPPPGALERPQRTADQRHR
jgi:hypothetical protein